MNCLLLIGLLCRYWFVLMILIKETIIASSVSLTKSIIILLNTVIDQLFLEFQNTIINGFSIKLPVSCYSCKKSFSDLFFVKFGIRDVVKLG